MLSMVNCDKVPFGDIIYHAILGKTIGHGSKHKGTLVFACFFQRLCEKALVSFNDTDQWHPPLDPCSKVSVALSQKVSHTFLTIVSSTSKTATLRSQLAERKNVFNIF